MEPCLRRLEMKEPLRKPPPAVMPAACISRICENKLGPPAAPGAAEEMEEPVPPPPRDELLDDAELPRPMAGGPTLLDSVEVPRRYSKS